MKKFLVLTLLAFLAPQLSAYDEKGMKMWKKHCIDCHGSPFRTAKMYTQYDWEEIRDGSSTPFIDMHAEDEESHAYLEDKMSKKKRKFIFNLLIGNASDAGAVPGGCDGNYCGP